ncbi:U11/U12 small nuclear ribonucleoprotein 25 kDa protein [Tanacetum coccineum]
MIDSTDVAVMNSATVRDLKLAVKKKVNEMEQSKMGHRHISWKHVWRNFCLSYHNEKLLNDDATLQDHGVRNHSQVISFLVSLLDALILSTQIPFNSLCLPRFR